MSFKTDGILGGARGILRRFGVELNTFFIVVVAFKRLNVIAVIYMLLALAIILHLHNVSGVQWAAYRSMKPQCALPSTTGRLWRFMTYLVGALLVFQYISSLGSPPSDSEEDELDRRYIADELDPTEGGARALALRGPRSTSHRKAGVQRHSGCRRSVRLGSSPRARFVV